MTKKRSARDPAHVLVYSTDPDLEVRCPLCGKARAACRCRTENKITNRPPVIRFERKGRGGKSVTVVTRLPADSAKLKELSSFLKRSLGVGGTYYVVDSEGVVEVQGEHQSAVRDLLKKFKENP